jgi:HD-GYP domain-containing protein (c-di-GMP phosphodiesterase class II)
MPVESREMLRCLFQTVGTLVDSATMNDPYAAPHRVRTSQIARVLAQLQGFDEDMIDGIRMAATLHDFGTILVPSEIILKAGPLTDAEFTAVKQHPIYGAEIFKDIEFPWPVTQIILQHHERLDGSGYPHGLAKDQIMLEAQVVAVADAMDAMTSDRPWRKAFSVEEALERLVKDRGTKFDPVSVDACIELYTKKKYLLDPDYYGRG